MARRPAGATNVIEEQSGRVAAALVPSGRPERRRKCRLKMGPSAGCLCLLAHLALAVDSSAGALEAAPDGYLAAARDEPGPISMMLLLNNLSADTASSLLPDYVIDDDDQMVFYAANGYAGPRGRAGGEPAKVRRQIGADYGADDDGWPPAGQYVGERELAAYAGLTGPPAPFLQRARLQQLSSPEGRPQVQDEPPGLFSPSGGPAGQEESALAASQQKVGPSFTREPPAFIHYLNSSDLVIPCAASGQPAPSIVSVRLPFWGPLALAREAPATRRYVGLICARAPAGFYRT